VRGAVFEYNTNSSDTNWQAVVTNSGGTQTPVDTGMAFSAQATYLCIVFIPRGSSSTYFYIRDLSNGAEGSATVAHLPESTALKEIAIVTTFDNVARNIRTGDMFTLVGGAI
jgi:alkylated DNA nucleotide flippase Atl1